MKKVIFITFTIYLFYSCTTIKTIEESKEIIFIDYGRYSEKGFLFSPYIYNGDFDPVGPVEYSFAPGANFVETAPDKNYPVKTKRWVVNDFNIYKAIDDVYNECLKMKADALIETKITTENNTIPFPNPVVIPVVKITGFAIKRK